MKCPNCGAYMDMISYSQGILKCRHCGWPAHKEWWKTEDEKKKTKRESLLDRLRNK